MKTKKQASKSIPRGAWILATVLVAGLAVAWWSGRSNSEETDMHPRLPNGTISGTAPKFSLTDIDGKTVKLEEFRGKVVILDFWATWCPPCKMEIPDFIALQSEYGGKGVQIVGVALDEPDKVRAFAMQNGMNYPVLLGSDQIAALYGGIDGIPTTFVIDKNGKIAGRYEGYRPRDVFESAIKRLL